MATTNATITINSDIMSYTGNVTTTMTMKKFGSTSGVEETTGLQVKKFNATSAVKIVDNTEGTAGKGSKVYIRNTGSSSTDFFYVALANGAAAATSTETIGRLYGGDWMLIPWIATAATTHDIHVAPSTTSTMTLEYMVFQE
jgi:hypothetical protein